MYYKVLKHNRVIDVLDRITYVKWQPEHQIMVLCDEEDAQAFISSGKDCIWHTNTLYKVPVSGYDTVELVEIDEYEYRQLKVLNGKTPEEIIDAFVLTLIEDKII